MRRCIDPFEHRPWLRRVDAELVMSLLMPVQCLILHPARLYATGRNMISDLSSRLVSREYRRWVVLACGSLAMTCAGRVGRSSEHAVEQPPVSPRVLGIAHYD